MSTAGILDRSNESLRSDGFAPASVGDAAIWKIDGRARRPQDTYENSFEELFAKLKIRRPNSHFESLLRSFRTSGPTAHVLDPFGSGFFLPSSSSASSVTGLRLEPLDWARAGIDPKEMPAEVLGDITNPETWQTLDRSKRHFAAEYDGPFLFRRSLARRKTETRNSISPQTFAERN